jgi:hypothetical protein
MILCQLLAGDDRQRFQVVLKVIDGDRWLPMGFEKKEHAPDNTHQHCMFGGF